jgi:hypothetical protein
MNRRIREGIAEKRQAMQRISRRIPYGFDLAEDGHTLIENDTEQAVIDWMHKLQADGQSYFAIAEALTEFTLFIELMPRCYEGYMERGTVWAHLGAAKRFEDDFDTAMDLRPNDGSVYNAMGMGYGILSEWVQAQ